MKLPPPPTKEEREEKARKLQGAIDRVLDATGRRALGNNFDTSELARLLDQDSVPRTVLSVVAQERQRRFAKERRAHFAKAARLAAELHALLTDEPFGIEGRLGALGKRGSGFPIGEWDGDPFKELPEHSPAIGSYQATVNGIGRLRDRLEEHVQIFGDSPLVGAGGFSEAESLITGAVTSAWNALKGHERYTPASRSNTVSPGDAEDSPWTQKHKSGGPFVRFAVAVMGELGHDVAPGTVAKAITKAKAAAQRRHGGKSPGG